MIGNLILPCALSLNTPHIATAGFGAESQGYNPGANITGDCHNKYFEFLLSGTGNSYNKSDRAIGSELKLNTLISYSNKNIEVKVPAGINEGRDGWEAPGLNDIKKFKGNTIGLGVEGGIGIGNLGAEYIRRVTDANQTTTIDGVGETRVGAKTEETGISGKYTYIKDGLIVAPSVTVYNTEIQNKVNGRIQTAEGRDLIGSLTARNFGKDGFISAYLNHYFNLNNLDVGISGTTKAGNKSILGKFNLATQDGNLANASLGLELLAPKGNPSKAYHRLLEKGVQSQDMNQSLLYDGVKQVRMANLERFCFDALRQGGWGAGLYLTEVRDEVPKIEIAGGVGIQGIIPYGKILTDFDDIIAATLGLDVGKILFEIGFEKHPEFGSKYGDLGKITGCIATKFK